MEYNYGKYTEYQDFVFRYQGIAPPQLISVTEWLEAYGINGALIQAKNDANKIVFKLVMTDGYVPDEEDRQVFNAIAHDLSVNVFNENPVEIHFSYDTWFNTTYILN